MGGELQRMRARRRRPLFPHDGSRAPGLARAVRSWSVMALLRRRQPQGLLRRRSAALGGQLCEREPPRLGHRLRRLGGRHRRGKPMAFMTPRAIRLVMTMTERATTSLLASPARSDHSPRYFRTSASALPASLASEITTMRTRSARPRSTHVCSHVSYSLKPATVASPRSRQKTIGQALTSGSLK